MVLESSREIVGDGLVDLIYTNPDARKREQGANACRDDVPTQVWAAEFEDEITGFITFKIDPDLERRGIGTQIYEFVIDKMKDAGINGAIVVTGGDDAHAPRGKPLKRVRCLVDSHHSRTISSSNEVLLRAAV